MESTQVADPPDISEVKLKILASDPKAAEVYFQNSLNSSTPILNTNPYSKSPEEFPRDVRVPGGMMALLEDQNKNRLKSTTVVTTDVISSPFPHSTTVSTDEVSNGKSDEGSKSCTDASGTTTSNHVEIDVDMTLPQSTAEEVTLMYDALVKRNSNATGEIKSNSQKTDNSGGSCNSKGTIVIMNNLSGNAAQSSSVTLGHRNQDERNEMQQQHRQDPSSPKLLPCSEKDLEILKSVRKVYVQLSDDNIPFCYIVLDESMQCLFGTLCTNTNGCIWSTYFKQHQKVILVVDRNHQAVLSLEFGISRTISCCQTLGCATMKASFMPKPEEPICMIFKDKACCVSCCCCPQATYETVPQIDSIQPFTVLTKGRWKNRAELMVKHKDGSILGFIDKDQNSYSLTMGENLGPSMKICLIGFLIAMDVMDRQDAGKLSCYLRPTTILLIFLLLLLCLTICGYLLHHFSSMFFSAQDDSVLCETCDVAGSRRTAPVPHFNNDRVSDATTSSGGTTGISAIASAIVNASLSSLSSSPTSEFHFGSSSLSANTAGNTDMGANNSSSWPLF